MNRGNEPDRAAACPGCGRPPTPGGAQGLCVRCLLGSALLVPDDDSGEPEGDPLLGSLLEGRIVGRYELLDNIARGGMGTVFRARQRQPERMVALKVISAGELATRTMVERFHNEALAAARLDHPHIVPIFEVGEDRGWHFFSMQLVEGRTLADLIRGGLPDPATAVRLLVKIARAVEHAHQRGILHRDLKPTNILIDAAGEPHLTDFGLAKVLERESDLTLSHAVLGTPAYMSPEQAGGRTRDITTATDVYGLGAVFYEMLAGRPPFEGASPPALLRRIVEEDPPALRPRRPRPRDSRGAAAASGAGCSAEGTQTVPRDLESICLKCLEKDPARRYPTAGALADDLDRWLRHEPVRARPVGAWERGVKWVRRQPARAGLAATVVLSGFALTLVSLVYNFRLDQARTTAEASARQARRQLVDEHLRDAGRRAAAGDGLTALFPLIEALRLEAPDRAGPIRERIDLTHRFSPELLHLWDAGRTPVQLRFSPDHRHLIGLLRPGGLRVWDLGSGRVIFQSDPGVDSLTGVHLAPDGSRVLELLADPPYARVRELPGGEVRPLTLDGPAGTAGGFSPDGRTLVTGGEAVRFWDATSLAAVPARVPPGGAGDLVLFSPDGRLLLIAHARDGIRVANLVEGTVQSLGLDPGAPVPGLAEFSPDGRYLATSAAEELHLLDTATGRPVLSAPHSGLLFQLAFDPAGRYFAAASFRDQARIWSWVDSNTRSNRTIQAYRRPVVHESGANQVQFSPDGRLLATAGFDYQVRLLEATRHQLVGPVLHHTALVEALAFSEDARWLATGDANGLVRVWDLQPRGLRFVPYVTAKPTPCFTPDGRFLVARERSDRLVVVEAATGRVEDRPLWAPDGLRRPDDATEPAEENWRDAADRGAPNDIVLDPTGRWVAVALGVRGVGVWDVSARTQVRAFRLPSPALSVVFSADGEVLAVGTRAEGVHRLAWRDSTTPAQPVLQWSFPVETIDWSRDGRWMATGTSEAVQVWDAVNGVRVGDTLRVDGRLASLRFSPSGHHLLVAASNDRIEPSSAQLIEVPSLRPVGPGMAHGDGISAAVFSPEGGWVATGGEDHTVRLWRTADGSTAAPTMRHAGIVNTLSFHPSGRLLATAGNDGYVRLWDVPGGDLCAPPLALGRSVPTVLLSPDGRRVLAATHTEGTWLFDLQLESRPIQLLERLAWGQTALRPGAAGSLGQMRVPRLAAEFADRAGLPRLGSPEMRAAWHDQMASLAEIAGDRFRAAFHLARLARLRPEDPNVQVRLGRVVEPRR